MSMSPEPSSATIVARQVGLLNEDIFNGRATFDEETGQVISLPDASPTQGDDVAEAPASVGQEELNPTTEPALAGANRS